MKIEISDSTYAKIKDQILAEEGKLKEKKEKRFEIKNRYTGDVIYSSTKTTYKEACEEAVSSGVNLREADLREADLRGVKFYGADLCEADLYGADLREADFMNVKFYGKGGTTMIKKDQVDDFFRALGIIVE